MFPYEGGKIMNAYILLCFVAKKWSTAMSILETQVQSPPKVTEMFPYTEYVLYNVHSQTEKHHNLKILHLLC